MRFSAAEPLRDGVADKYVFSTGVRAGVNSGVFGRGHSNRRGRHKSGAPRSGQLMNEPRAAPRRPGSGDAGGGGGGGRADRDLRGAGEEGRN